MDARRKDERRRCRECGQKYMPDSRSRRHQKTCGKACREERRKRQARSRYAAAPVRAREAARERQRRSRSKRAKGPVPSEEQLPAEVTRVIEQEMKSLTSEGWLARAEVERALNRVARQAGRRGMSRAGFDTNPRASPSG
jgi:hypothetical protein